MDSEIMYKMVKYLACGAMMFFILKYVVNDKMPLFDIALISVITILVFAVVENGYSLVRGKNNKLNQSEQNEKTGKMCESFCAMKEHMGNTISEIPPPMVTSSNIQSKTTYNSTANMAMVSPNITENPVPNKMSETDVMNSIINSMKNDNISQDSSEETNMPQKNIITEDRVYSEENTEYDKIPQEMEEQKVKVSDETLSDYQRFQKRFSEIVDERQNRDDDYITKTGKIDRNNDGSYTVNYQRRSPDIVASGSRAKNGVTKETDMKYNITSFHTVPPNLNKGSFEYGYSFLPPANWYPTPPYPPVCVTEKQCPVCPVYTTGTNVELKEWDSSRRITAPDEINVKYIEEKLNSGR
jgi:hypothetical protein